MALSTIATQTIQSSGDAMRSAPLFLTGYRASASVMKSAPHVAEKVFIGLTAALIIIEGMSCSSLNYGTYSQIKI